jgi:hypothetical protein
LGVDQVESHRSHAFAKEAEIEDRLALDDVGIVGEREMEGVVKRINPRLTRVGIGESGGGGSDEERGR